MRNVSRAVELSNVSYGSARRAMDRFAAQGRTRSRRTTASRSCRRSPGSDDCVARHGHGTHRHGAPGSRASVRLRPYARPHCRDAPTELRGLSRAALLHELSSGDRAAPIPRLRLCVSTPERSIRPGDELYVLSQHRSLLSLVSCAERRDRGQFAATLRPRALGPTALASTTRRSSPAEHAELRLVSPTDGLHQVPLVGRQSHQPARTGLRCGADAEEESDAVHLLPHRPAPLVRCAKLRAGFAKLRVGSVREARRGPDCRSARPLGQCGRYCRQHCTGLALRAARLRAARRRERAAGERAARSGNATRARDSVRCMAASVRTQALDARFARAQATAGTTRRLRARSVSPFHGGSAETARCPGGRAQCNAAGSFGSIGRAVARKDIGRLGAVSANEAAASERSMQTKPRSVQCRRSRRCLS